MASFRELKMLMEIDEDTRKIRRRQSDARWRANLTSCYETLKNIVPVNVRPSKKKVSKVLHNGI
jgi:hypothetical protein